MMSLWLTISLLDLEDWSYWPRCATIENILLYFRERDWSKLCTCKNNENAKDGGITAYKPNTVSDIHV